MFSCFRGNLPIFVLNSRWLHFIWVQNYPFSWLASVISCTTAFVLRHSIKGHALSYLLWPSSLSWIIFFRTTTIALSMKNMMPTAIKMINSIFHGDSTSICLLLKIGVRAFSLSVEWNLKQLTSGKWGEVLIGSLNWHVRGFEPNRGHYFVPLPFPALCSWPRSFSHVVSLSIHLQNNPISGLYTHSCLYGLLSTITMKRSDTQLHLWAKLSLMAATIYLQTFMWPTDRK